jgi:hypothetical protein
MRSRFLYIALAILVARKLLLSRNVMTKASKMLPTKQGPRATLVRHPSARRRLIRRSRRKLEDAAAKAKDNVVTDGATPRRNR